MDIAQLIYHAFSLAVTASAIVLPALLSLVLAFDDIARTGEIKGRQAIVVGVGFALSGCLATRAGLVMNILMFTKGE